MNSSGRRRVIRRPASRLSTAEQMCVLLFLFLSVKFTLLFKKVNRVKSRYIFYIYDRGCSHNSMSLQPHFFGTDIEAFSNQLDDEDFWEFLRMERFPWIMRTWSLEDLRRYAILYRDRVVLTSDPPTRERRRCPIPSDTAQFETYLVMQTFGSSFEAVFSH